MQYQVREHKRDQNKVQTTADRNYGGWNVETCRIQTAALVWRSKYAIWNEYQMQEVPWTEA